MRKHERLKCSTCGERLGKKSNTGHIIYANPLICPACKTDNTARIKAEVIEDTGSGRTAISTTEGATPQQPQTPQDSPQQPQAQPQATPQPQREPGAPLSNPRHEAFCQQHAVRKLTATRAYMSAYPDSGYESAQRSASDLLRNHEIQSRLTELRAEVARKTITDGILERSERIARLERRAAKLDEVIAARASDPEMADVHGGHTGLLVKTYKAAGGVVVEEYAVDTGMLKELRAIEQQAAQELGEWLTKTAVDVREVPALDIPEDASLETIRAAKEKLREAVAILHPTTPATSETVQ